MRPARRPLIGLTGRRFAAGRVSGTPDSWATAEVDLHFADYAVQVDAAGGLAVQLPRGLDVRAGVARLDGLVLTGGNDIDPRRYGQEPLPQLGPVEPARDRFELELLDEALARGVPVLGVCRGAQLINVWRGGTLHQHIPEFGAAAHAAFQYPRDHRGHVVDFAPGSRLADLYGASCLVNSLHHQAIDQLGDGILATGRSPDGVIEAAELRDADILGVQWHPEVLPSDPVFTWLCERAASRWPTDQMRSSRAMPA